MRPLVSVYLGVSLDLCIAEAEGALDFLAPYQQPPEEYGYAAFMAEIDAVILGRNTCDTVMGFDGPWPFGDRPVVVLTHRPLPPGPATARAHAGGLTPLLTEPGAQAVRHVYLDGGAAVRQGLREGVVDALTLSVVPELLGTGRRFSTRLSPARPGRSWAPRPIQAAWYDYGIAAWITLWRHRITLSRAPDAARDGPAFSKA